ncbi:MAG: NMD3-related protein [archaeon]
MASSSSRFCPKCGKTEGRFIGHFCQDCFFHDHPDLVTIPPILELNTCNYCGKVSLAGKWVEWDDELVHMWIEDQVKVKRLGDVSLHVRVVPSPRTKKERSVTITVNGTIEDSPLEYVARSTLFVRGGICNDDMLVTSNYYEGIVQIRFGERTPEKVKKVQEQVDAALAPIHRSDSKAVVVNWVLQKHGVDAWIVSGKAAKAAAIYVQRKNAGTLSMSGKLIGIDSHTNKTKNRMTYLVRVP